MQIELGKIEEYEHYIDKAFKRGKSRLTQSRIKNRKETKVEKYRHLEGIRLAVIKDSITNDMNKILEHMPQFKDLTPFYKEIFACFVDLDMYRKSLASIKWAIGQLNTIFKKSSSNVAKQDSVKDVVAKRNIFLARCSSVLKQINKNLQFLDKARKQIKEVPSIKSDLFTVAITGFPNVGKSTLLGKITDSKPEVNSYAFTTKGLMIGYIKEKEHKIQIIDTPGTLNRQDKMNKIEKMAHLAMQKVANTIVYVFDLTESYPIDDQVKLYNNIKKLDKEVIVYFSKSDILKPEQIKSFKIEGLTDTEEIKKEIIKWSQISQATCEEL